jgi:hypothetical protein
MILFFTSPPCKVRNDIDQELLFSENYIHYEIALGKLEVIFTT